MTARCAGWWTTHNDVSYKHSSTLYGTVDTRANLDVAADGTKLDKLNTKANGATGAIRPLLR